MVTLSVLAMVPMLMVIETDSPVATTLQQGQVSIFSMREMATPPSLQMMASTCLEDTQTKTTGQQN